MKAVNDIFIVDELMHTDGLIKVSLSINTDSSIFKGHFPGQPVVPGACMLQIVKEVLERAVGHAVQLRKGDNLKFIGMIEAGATNAVGLEIAYKLIADGISVNAKLVDGERICFKFQGRFART